MTDSIMFEATPLDFHLQESELQSVLDLPPSGLPLPVPYGAEPCEKYIRLEDRCEDAGILQQTLSQMVWQKYQATRGDVEGVEHCRLPDGVAAEPHEMIVHGTHIDERILPGFRYHVRILSQKRKDRYQFAGQALYLSRISQGYGKRLTFESPLANINPNYFWSDTHPNGYAFVISAVQPGQEFVLCHQNRRPFGCATVKAVGRHQIEVDSVTEGKATSKRVLVAMQITVNYTCAPHGMLSLRADEDFEVTATALVVKESSSAKAVTKVVQEVFLQGHGECLLFNKED